VTPLTIAKRFQNFFANTLGPPLPPPPFRYTTHTPTPPSVSKHSNKIDEFYATSTETARWLLAELGKLKELSGTALEPCAGGFVFPDNAPSLQWTTNDLNQWGERCPDTLCDFLTAEFPRHDFIITNPPFGPNNKLAFAFLQKAATLTDVIAMVVPSSMGPLTSRIHNALPKDFRLAFSKQCPNQFFDLPDGSHRPVRTHGIIWLREDGYKRQAPKKPKLDARTSFFEFTEDGDFAIRIYGDGIGDLKPFDETVGGTWARLKFQRNKQCIGLKLLMAYPWRWHYGNSGKGRAPWDGSPGVVPSISTSKLLHFANCMAVLEGRLDPDPDINYDEFLEELTDCYLAGLTVPLRNE
jgi:hypothetical protein